MATSLSEAERKEYFDTLKPYQQYYLCKQVKALFNFCGGTYDMTKTPYELGLLQSVDKIGTPRDFEQAKQVVKEIGDWVNSEKFKSLNLPDQELTFFRNLALWLDDDLHPLRYWSLHHDEMFASADEAFKDFAVKLLARALSKLYPNVVNNAEAAVKESLKTRGVDFDSTEDLKTVLTKPTSEKELRIRQRVFHPDKTVRLPYILRKACEEAFKAIRTPEQEWLNVTGAGPRHTPRETRPGEGWGSRTGPGPSDAGSGRGSGSTETRGTGPGWRYSDPPSAPGAASSGAAAGAGAGSGSGSGPRDASSGAEAGAGSARWMPEGIEALMAFQKWAEKLDERSADPNVLKVVGLLLGFWEPRACDAFMAEVNTLKRKSSLWSPDVYLAAFILGVEQRHGSGNIQITPEGDSVRFTIKDFGKPALQIAKVNRTAFYANVGALTGIPSQPAYLTRALKEMFRTVAATETQPQPPPSTSARQRQREPDKWHVLECLTKWATDTSTKVIRPFAVLLAQVMAPESLRYLLANAQPSGSFMCQTMVDSIKHNVEIKVSADAVEFSGFLSRKSSKELQLLAGSFRSKYSGCSSLFWDIETSLREGRWEFVSPDPDVVIPDAWKPKPAPAPASLPTRIPAAATKTKQGSAPFGELDLQNMILATDEAYASNLRLYWKTPAPVKELGDELVYGAYLESTYNNYFAWLNERYVFST
jgi:hypothetical protein